MAYWLFLFELYNKMDCFLLVYSSICHHTYTVLWTATMARIEVSPAPQDAPGLCAILSCHPGNLWLLLPCPIQKVLCFRKGNKWKYKVCNPLKHLPSYCSSSKGLCVSKACFLLSRVLHCLGWAPGISSTVHWRISRLLSNFWN